MTPPRRPACPTCGAPVAWADNPARPFCTLACKLVDLGGWLDENYRFAGEPLASAPGPDVVRRSDG